MAGPFGKLGTHPPVTRAIRRRGWWAPSTLASLKGSIGNLDRVQQWHRVFGMVNSAPGFNEQPQGINGFSEPILAVYGAKRGTHTRSAVGMAELPFHIPVEMEGELHCMLECRVGAQAQEPTSDITTIPCSPCLDLTRRGSGWASRPGA